MIRNNSSGIWSPDGEVAVRPGQCWNSPSCGFAAPDGGNRPPPSASQTGIQTVSMSDVVRLLRHHSPILVPGCHAQLDTAPFLD